MACDGSLKEEGHDFVSCYYSSSGSYSAYHVNDNGSGSPLSPAAMGAASSYDGWDFRNVWQMGNGDYPYPTLRALPGSQPSEDPGHAATDPLVQLATCELAAFNPGSSWVGQTVDDFLASAPFQARDRAIWNGQDQKYSDFFSAVLKGYEFVSANGEGPKKHVALKDPSTGDIVLALDPHGIITYADSFASILQSDAKGCFDGAMEVCKEVKGANPDSPIHATGGFLGGMAAAYVSNASGSPANVFNASAGYGAKLSWLTQGEFANGNGFEGIDRPLCKNYYASSMSLLYGYGSDVLSSAKIDANPGGSMYRLNSLYEATDDGFALREATESNPEAETKTFYVADAESVLRSVAESVNNLDAGKPDLSFATKSTQLTLGTTGKDVRLTGVEGAAAPYDMLLPQIIYTGSGEGDLMRGGQTADIFVAGSGSSRLIGNEGSDLYVIGDDADVHISDICASDGNVLCKGIMGVMKAIVFANLEQPGKVKEGLEDLLDSAVEILTDTKQDTIVFRNCSFDDMQVALVDAPFPDSDYYEINAGSSTVRVDRRFFLKRDFLIVDASADGESGRKAEGKSLKDLYEEKNGKLAPRSAEPSEGEVGEDAANAVSLHFEGSGVSVSVRDASTGAEIYSFGPDEDFAYSDEYGTFVGCADTHCVDAVYDASKVEVALMGGTTSRIMTSPEVGSGEDCLSYADWITPSEFDELRIEADGGVSLVGVNADGTEKTIASDTIGAGEVDSSTPTETIDISAATAAKIPEQAWTGGTVSPSIEISYGGIALEDGIDFTVSYENNAGPGEAAAIVSGKGLFTGAKRIPFLIYDATPPEPDPEPQPATAERLGGADRYATMALVSQAAFPDDGSCGTVVVARGDDFPDALAASGLAGVTGAQVLLTNTSGLTSATRDEIVRLGATRTFVVGDKNSVSDRAFGEISSLVGGNAVRLGGADRYATALKIYKAGSGGWGSTAIVAIGTKPADALSASPIAYGMKAPIFLANANGDLSPETLGEIAKGGFDTVLVMGSEHSVSAAAERSLERIAPTVRFSGSDRYETSRMVANWALGNGFACSHAVLAAGRDGKFTDALVASSLGGRNSSPLVLIDDGGAVDRCVSEVIAPHRGSIETVFAIGDEHTVSSAAFETVRRAIT